MNDRILRAARRQPTDTTPIWIMRQAGRYLPEYRAIRGNIAFLDLCKNPDLAAEVTVQPVTRLGVDAAIIFSDILIPVEAMGMHLELGDKGPHLPSPLRSEADVAKLVVPDPIEKTGFLAEAIRRTRKALNDSVPVIGIRAIALDDHLALHRLVSDLALDALQRQALQRLRRGMFGQACARPDRATGGNRRGCFTQRRFHHRRAALGRFRLEQRLRLLFHGCASIILPIFCISRLVPCSRCSIVTTPPFAAAR